MPKSRRKNISKSIAVGFYLLEGWQYIFSIGIGPKVCTTLPPLLIALPLLFYLNEMLFLEKYPQETIGYRLWSALQCKWDIQDAFLLHRSLWYTL
jgi:hypothetical protein